MGKEADDPDFSPHQRRSQGNNRSCKISDPEDLKRRTHEALKVSLKYTELLANRMNVGSSISTSSCLTSSSSSCQEEDAIYEGPDKQDHHQSGSVQIAGVNVKKWPPGLLTGAVLRDYQLEGLRWLMVLDSNGANGILADEMGLGKTIQMISLFALLIENNVGSEGPFLVISPLSTLRNWASEFSKFAPKVPVILYHGTKSERASLRKDFLKHFEVEGQQTYPVVVTSFEMPLRDHTLRGIRWRYIVIDEGHRLKNHRELRLYHTITCVLLTGTPLQNNLTELWSLLNFILPEIVQDRELFESWLDSSDFESSGASEKLIEAEEKEKILTTLHKILKPFILRRGKTDVGFDIPPKTEVIVYAPLTELQKALYSFVVERSLCDTQDYLYRDPVLLERALRRGQQLPETALTNTVKTRKRKRKSQRDGVYEHLSKEDRAKENLFGHHSSDEEEKEMASSNCIPLERYFGLHEEYRFQLKVHNPLMSLRKICNHPYLVAFPVLPGTQFLKVDENIIKRSGKFKLLDEILKRLKKNSHKVVLFSHFIETLDLLQSYLEIRNYKFVRLDGTCSLNNRQDNINKFSDEGSIFIFLISTRAGGLGINLTAADSVIIFDSDWNPQVDLQAQDRCHRIGQTKPVAVYRLVVGGTVDEQIVKRAESKRQLEKLVIAGGKFRGLNQQHNLNLEELRELLQIQNNKVVFEDSAVYSKQQLDDLCNRQKLFPCQV